MFNLKDKYDQKIKHDLMKDLQLSNIMLVPCLSKVVLNIGVGNAIKDKALIKEAVDLLGLISGRKAVVTKAKKSVAGFKIREGFPIGAKVTLRRKVMYEFLARLINIYMPLIRDFRGISMKSFSKGNISIGIKEHHIFPEVEYNRFKNTFGLDITIVTNTPDNKYAMELLHRLGIPFINEKR